MDTTERARLRAALTATRNELTQARATIDRALDAIDRALEPVRPVPVVPPLTAGEVAREWLDVADAAAAMDLHPDTLRAHLRAGRVPGAVQLWRGGRWRIPADVATGGATC